MSLDERIDFGDQQLATTQGTGFCLALTEPNGGEVRIGIVTDANPPRDAPPQQIVAITCNAQRARQIAASLIELAEVIEANA